MHVRHAILQLFSGEAVKENGKISVLVQPDFDFAMELLQVLGEQNPNFDDSTNSVLYEQQTRS